MITLRIPPQQLAKLPHSLFHNNSATAKQKEISRMFTVSTAKRSHPGNSNDYIEKPLFNRASKFDPLIPIAAITTAAAFAIYSFVNRNSSESDTNVADECSEKMPCSHCRKSEESEEALQQYMLNILLHSS